MRRVRLLKCSVVLSMVATLLSLVQAQPASAQATAMFPDLRTLPPRDLRFDRTDVSVDGSGAMHNVLRFSNTAWNAGVGKLEIRAQIDPVTKAGPAYQRIYNSDGSYTERQFGRLYYHAVHNHYHLDDWGVYQLWTKAAYDAWIASNRTTGSPTYVAPKTSSCATDEEFIATQSGTPGTIQYPASGCMPDANGTIVEGLSPGWGDTYDWYRFEQWIDLGQDVLADGQYVLRSDADPDGIIEESATGDPALRADNEAVTPFTVSGGALVDGASPTGTVTINDVDDQAGSPTVSVKLFGRDDVSGVDQVRVSNDGTTWSSMGYTGRDSTPMAITWNLTDAAYGGTTSTGVKTVYAQFHDRSGKWSSTVTDTIVYSPCAGTGTQSTYSSAVAADGPVSYWRLGDSCSAAADETGPNTGTYDNGATEGAASLISSDPADKAVHLDGVDDSVAVSDSTSLDLATPLSVEAWIKPDRLPTSGGWASIVTKQEAYSLQFNGPSLEFTIVQNGQRRRLLAPSGTIVAGSTYHVVGTIDGATQRLYVNGAQVASAALSGGASATAQPLHIGSWDGNGEFFAGTVDEVAIYGKALTAANVSAHRSAASGASTTTVNAPSNPVAKAVTSARVDVSWTDNSNNEENFVLDRSTSSAFTSPATFSLPPDVTTYSDTGLAPSTTYYYRVRATNGTVTSPYSATASATTNAVAATSYASTVLADAPVAFCRLGESSGTVITDETGTNAGTYVNGPGLGAASLLATDGTNKAVAFDGTRQYGRIAANPSLDFTSAFSIEAWIKPSAIPSTGSWATVVTKAESYSVQFNGPRLEFTVIQAGTRRRLQVPAGAIVAGTTYHVVATFDGSRQRLYVNGVEVASGALSGKASVTTAPVTIASWDGAGEYFRGTIDEVALYGRVLSAQQVAAHRSAGTG